MGAVEIGGVAYPIVPPLALCWWADRDHPVVPCLAGHGERAKRGAMRTGAHLLITVVRATGSGQTHPPGVGAHLLIMESPMYAPTSRPFVGAQWSGLQRQDTSCSSTGRSPGG